MRNDFLERYSFNKIGPTIKLGHNPMTEAAGPIPHKNNPHSYIHTSVSHNSNTIDQRCISIDCNIIMAPDGSKHLDKVVPKNAADAKELSMHDNEDSDSNEQEEDTNDKHTDTPTSVISATSNHHDITAEVRQGLQREDRGVFMWRMIFKIIMIAVAIVLTVATYVQLSRSETKDFTNQVSTAMVFCSDSKIETIISVKAPLN
jgi:hypothetical protein